MNETRDGKNVACVKTHLAASAEVSHVDDARYAVDGGSGLLEGAENTKDVHVAEVLYALEDIHFLQKCKACISTITGQMVTRFV